MEDALSKLYYDTKSSVSFSGVNKLYKAGKKLHPELSLRDVKDWLKKQSTYTLHRPIRRHYERSRYFVTGIDKLWQIDLADMSMIYNVNDSFTFILTCIDVFSKFAWAIPVMNKTGREVTRAFKEIMVGGRTPEKLQSDKGKEFLNMTFQNFLKEHDIDFFTCNNPDIKCSVVERFNRTIKTKIWKYFTKQRTYRYVDILHNLINGYNNAEHRSIGMTPLQASDSTNEQTVYHNLYHKMKIKGKPHFRAEDFVRISKSKGIFEKGYLPNWSEEIFKIIKVTNMHPPMYHLEDLMGEAVEGRFYEQELQVITQPDSYWVQKVIKTRERRGKKQYFVKWLGYPEKFNSWISEQDGFLPLPTE